MYVIIISNITYIEVIISQANIFPVSVLGSFQEDGLFNFSILLMTSDFRY